MLKVKLVVVGGDAKSKEVNLRLPTVIGRGRDVNLTLPHALVSRRHAELFDRDGYLYVRDLGSLNGTYVNNRKIGSEQRLAPNELLTLGNVTFRAMYEAGGIQNADGADQTGLNDTGRGGKLPASENNEEKDETVQFERIDGAHEKEDLKPSSARKPLKSVATERSKPDADKKGAAASSKPDPATNPSKPSSSADATDKVETPSDIFSGDEEFLTPDKSISISALESLPPMNPALSMMGSALNLGDQPQRPSVDAIDLDVEGRQRPDSPGKSDAALGSFLKKLPR